MRASHAVGNFRALLSLAAVFFSQGTSLILGSKEGKSLKQTARDRNTAAHTPDVCRGLNIDVKIIGVIKKRP